MLRKFTAIFFLSLASMIMLAFTVFPHHHHQEYICFATSHCQNDHGQQTHSHDAGNSSHNCVNTLFQTQLNKGHHSEDQLFNGNHFPFTFSDCLIADLLDFFSLRTENQNHFTSYYQEQLHSSGYISERIGRAPPFGA